MKKIFYCLIILLSSAFIFLFNGVKAAAISQSIEQSNSYLISFTSDKTTDRTTILTFGEYDLILYPDYIKIDYMREQEWANIPVEQGALYSLYIQYQTPNIYYIAIFQTINFVYTDANGTIELYRYSLQTQETSEDIILNTTKNLISIIPLTQEQLDDVHAIRRLILANFHLSFKALMDYAYQEGAEYGAGVDLDKDYIKTEDATSWMAGIFRAFSGFFAIKFGDVSLGAIIIIPLAISFVWFILRLFRGGGSN